MGKMSRQPRRVADLANVLGVLPEEVSLLCNFCRGQLSSQDLHAFDQKCFKLLWKGDGVYGCCSVCARWLARSEHDIYCRVELSGFDVLVLTRVPLSVLFMRCRFCLKVLTFLEKLDMIRFDLNFCHIRGWWRGICRFCRAP